jgi:AAA15 family ATPase/GTPase
MLLSFIVQNFRSFREPQELSFVASGRYTDHSDHLRPIPGDPNKALPIAALYGANGAGKSNLIKALDFLRQLILQKRQENQGTGRQAFLFDEKSPNEDTKFTIQIVVRDHIFFYGVNLDDKRIHEEWLSCKENGGSEEIIFERLTKTSSDSIYQTEIELGKLGLGANHTKLKDLAGIAPEANQTFLNDLLFGRVRNEIGKRLEMVREWFLSLMVISPKTQFSGLIDLVSRDSFFKEFAEHFLSQVGTGVQGFSLEEEKDQQIVLNIISQTKNIEARQPLDGQTITATGEDGSHRIVSKTPEGQWKIHRLDSCHSTEGEIEKKLPLNQESDGTLRLLDFIPLLHSAQKGYENVWVVDEIDRSLHPLITKKIVRDFLQNCQTGKAKGQFLFTTHDTLLLDLDLLRRDEIWFAQKDIRKETTELYSLSDYKVRTDLRINKGYMEGRFGAVPAGLSELPDWAKEIQGALSS